MKTSLRKLRGLALHKHEAKDHRIDLQPRAQLDELAQASQVSVSSSLSIAQRLRQENRLRWKTFWIARFTDRSISSTRNWFSLCGGLEIRIVGFWQWRSRLIRSPRTCSGSGPWLYRKLLAENCVSIDNLRSSVYDFIIVSKSCWCLLAHDKAINYM